MTNRPPILEREARARGVLAEARRQQKSEDAQRGRVNLTMQGEDAVIRAMLAFADAPLPPSVPVAGKRVYRVIPVRGHDSKHAVFDVVMGDAIAICPDDIAAEKVRGALEAHREQAASPPLSGAIPAGMVRWDGGHAAPEDWDGGPVLLRDGRLYDHVRSFEGLQHLGVWSQDDHPSDIIAYTPVATASPPLSGVVEALELILHCTPANTNFYDCGDPFEIARKALDEYRALIAEHAVTREGRGD